MDSLPSCIASTQLLQNTIKSLQRIPLKYQKDNPLRFLIFGTEESTWITLRVIDKDSYIEVFITDPQGVKIALNGYVNVDVQDFKNIIQHLPKMAPFTKMQAIQKSSAYLTIQTGKECISRIPFHDATRLLNYFPQIESETEMLAIKASSLMECLSRNDLLSSSSRKVDYENFGVLVVQRDEFICFVSTDSNRLILTEGRWEAINSKMPPELSNQLLRGIVLPVSVIEHLVGILSHLSPNTIVSLVHSQMPHSEGYTWVIAQEETVYRINCITNTRNEFPSYQSFLDRQYSSSAIALDTSSFIAAFKRIKNLAEFCLIKIPSGTTIDTHTSPHVEVSGIKDNKLFSWENILYNSYENPAVKDVELGFQTSYLLDALQKIPTKQVLFQFGGGCDPIYLSPIFDEHYTKDLKTYLYVVMPVNLFMAISQYSPT